MQTRIPDLTADAACLIKTLRLEPHPEGGYFREVYRSAETLPAAGLPFRYQGERAVSTAIYFMLASGTFSAFHRLRSDEIWHFYAGSAIDLHLLHTDGRHEGVVNGPDIPAGQQPMVVLPAGTWFAAAVQKPGSYGLVGCTVAPGFDFADFELAQRAELVNLFPMHTELITAFTRS